MQYDSDGTENVMDEALVGERFAELKLWAEEQGLMLWRRGRVRIHGDSDPDAHWPEFWLDGRVERYPEQAALAKRDARARGDYERFDRVSVFQTDDAGWFGLDAISAYLTDHAAR